MSADPVDTQAARQRALTKYLRHGTPYRLQSDGAADFIDELCDALDAAVAERDELRVIDAATAQLLVIAQAERDALQERIDKALATLDVVRELAEQMQLDAAGQSDMLYRYSIAIRAVLVDDKGDNQQ